MIRVLFVCLGNICRSPMAEAVFNHKVRRRGLHDRISADSCGTAGYHIGESPDQRTIDTARAHGVPINHVGRQLAASDLVTYDYVLAMDSDNHAAIRRLAEAGQGDKVCLLRSFDPSGGEEVPDPYYGDEDDFEEVYDILDRTLDRFLEHVVREQGLS